MVSHLGNWNQFGSTLSDYPHSVRKSAVVASECVLTLVDRTDSLTFVADHITTSQGAHIKAVWIEPAPPALINNMLHSWMTAAFVQPTRVPGYWIDKANIDIPAGSPLLPGEKLIYHFHGGAYIRFSASPDDVVSILSRSLLERCKPVRRVFSLEYRLSRASPDPVESPFPAALLDALAGYQYLVGTLGFDPQNIIIVGDSAGGNLAHALTRYLVEHPELELLPPGAVLLLSPWIDLSDSHEETATVQLDYIGGRKCATAVYARGAFFGPLGEGISLSRYLSPGSIHPRAELAPFIGWPRTMVVNGDAEALIGSITAMVNRMKLDLGDRLTHYEVVDAVHDFLVLPFCEPERTRTLDAIATWIGD